MKNYSFQKLKENIFIINYSDNETNIFFKKILKIPITLNENKFYKEYELSKYFETTEYNDFFIKIIDCYNFKNILLNHNITLNININNNDILIKFNINELIDNNIIDINFINKHFELENNYSINDKINNYKKYIIINNISFLIIDYVENNISLLNYFLLDNISIFEKIICIKKTLTNINILHEKLNFIHGDFKTNNILYNLSLLKPIFIDFEFSYVIEINNNNENINNNENKFVYIKDINEINLYLKLEQTNIISINFLKLFDIYMFTLSFYIYNTQINNKFIFQQLINEINHYYEFNYYIFVIIYYLLMIYNENNKIQLYRTNNKNYHKLCTYDSIYNIIYEQLEYIDNNKLKDCKDWIFNAFDNEN